MDDRIRLGVFRALYSGNSPLFRYGVGSQFPIHIIVKNGQVTLTGVVGSQSDKTFASLRAAQVPGTFSVTNNLEVKQG